jgi:hypothetical protein
MQPLQGLYTLSSVSDFIGGMLIAFLKSCYWSEKLLNYSLKIVDDCVEKESTKMLKLPKSVHYSYDFAFNWIVLRHVGETSSSWEAQNRMHSVGVSKKSCY